MKDDRKKAAMWPEGHWTIARYVCLYIAVTGIMVAATDVMGDTAAFIASVLGIAYVLLLTRHYTRAG